MTGAQASHKPQRIDEHGEWFDDALCQQVDANFFPVKGDRFSAQAAKAVCQLCTVQTECLTYALDHDERFGVWGGMSERERRGLHRARRAAS